MSSLLFSLKILPDLLEVVLREFTDDRSRAVEPLGLFDNLEHRQLVENIDHYSTTISEVS